MKTTNFKNPIYLGDPVNALHIFSDKHADEIILLDITRTSVDEPPNFDLIGLLASECFAPLTYGGRIKSVEDAKRIMRLGVEKISVNRSALRKPSLIAELSKQLGKSSVVASIDVQKSTWRPSRSVIRGAPRTAKYQAPVELARLSEQLGAGEILLTNVNHEGSRAGMDLSLITEVSRAVTVPVVAHGGVGSTADICECLACGANGVAVGSLFVLQGVHRAPLISYLTDGDMGKIAACVGRSNHD